MKERQILFGGPMVRAILEGRKTQTRRALKTQPLDVLPMKGDQAGKSWVGHMSMNPSRGVVFGCRYGRQEDRLWVREKHWIEPSERWIVYAADENQREQEQVDRWRPSIHMPRWASRITLKITDVRVQRVQEITPADCLSEGVEYERHGKGLGDACDEIRMIQSFINLWDSLNAKRGFGWESNPYVWAIEFERVEDE